MANTVVANTAVVKTNWFSRMWSDFVAWFDREDVVVKTDVHDLWLDVHPTKKVAANTVTANVVLALTPLSSTNSANLILGIVPATKS